MYAIEKTVEQKYLEGMAEARARRIGRSVPAHNMTPAYKVREVHRLLSTTKMSHRAIARKVGMSHAKVADLDPNSKAFGRLAARSKATKERIRASQFEMKADDMEPIDLEPALPGKEVERAAWLSLQRKLAAKRKRVKEGN